MNASDEQRAADKVVEAAGALNEAIREAAKIGLSVELSVVDVTTYGDPQTVQHISPSVERRTRLA